MENFEFIFSILHFEKILLFIPSFSMYHVEPLMLISIMMASDNG